MTVHIFSTKRWPNTEDTTDATAGAINIGTVTGGTAVKGVVVTIANDANAAPVTGVTYAGQALTLAGTAGDATEAGAMAIYALVGNTTTIPDDVSGTVAVTGATTANKFAQVLTLDDSSADLRISGTVAKNTQTASAFRAGTLFPTVGVHALAIGAMHDGNAEPPSTDVVGNYVGKVSGAAGTYWATSSAVSDYADYGTRAAEISRTTSNASSSNSISDHGGTVLIGYNTSVSEDWAMVGIVVEEVASGITNNDTGSGLIKLLGTFIEDFSTPPPDLTMAPLTH